eukprot:CAMPEP_0184702020 /NCGR_PEP_ID=MMETSP0313-20130426/22421_1 /TAXON_ID=2792 /ORGANISM="Porphyridium aerugineum, Strain SAG 1380-2" /LENGTH=118 /DNA_ID=CAMNT_0027162311 /DNA_START=42 /DNA_END=395 /DNA_ORIENTATION=-
MAEKDEVVNEVDTKTKDLKAKKKLMARRMIFQVDEKLRTLLHMDKLTTKSDFLVKLKRYVEDKGLKSMDGSASIIKPDGKLAAFLAPDKKEGFHFIGAWNYFSKHVKQIEDEGSVAAE